LLCGGAYAGGQISTSDTYVQPSDVGKLDAKPNTVTYYVACFDNEGFIRFAVNCGFKLWISYPPGEATDPMVNGGHVPAGYTTTAPRPLIYRRRHYTRNKYNRPVPNYDGYGKLKFAYDTDPTDKNRVTGTTVNGCPPRRGLPVVCRSYAAKIVYPVSEVSGEAQVDVQVTAPAGWSCPKFFPVCYGEKTYRNRDTVHIMEWDYWGRHRVGPYPWQWQYDPKPTRLAELPDPDQYQHYIKVRNRDPGHPDSVAFYIKEKHLLQVLDLADWFHVLSNPPRVLSLNDMTLVLGGLFDIHHDWAPPHRSHRNGTDTDINGDGVPCPKDHALIKAARRVIPYIHHHVTHTALLCERLRNGDWHKHVDFER